MEMLPQNDETLKLARQTIGLFCKKCVALGFPLFYESLKLTLRYPIGSTQLTDCVRTNEALSAYRLIHRAESLSLTLRGSLGMKEAALKRFGIEKIRTSDEPIGLTHWDIG